jgi:hypothetical protein
VSCGLGRRDGCRVPLGVTDVSGVEPGGNLFPCGVTQETFLAGRLARTLRHSKFNTRGNHQISLSSLYAVSADRFSSVSHTRGNCTATQFAVLWRPYHHQTWNSPIIVAVPLRSHQSCPAPNHALLQLEADFATSPLPYQPSPA